jgi:hypothetical protein
MSLKPKSRAPLAAVAVALFALALLAPGASAAPKLPTLVSTPQYKAFVQLVSELRDDRNKPHTPGEKSAFERQLTAKHSGAANRAKSLFSRGKQIAKAETQGRFRSAATKIRAAERAELADLRSQYADKMDTAARDYQDDADSIKARYDKRIKAAEKQIRQLRNQKAKAKNITRKDQIQRQIEGFSDVIANNREDEKEGLTRLSESYKKRKTAIRAAKAADTAEITEDRQEALENLRSRSNRVYNAKLGDLQQRRTNQLAQLENKLQAGRSYITSMPDAGN